MAVVVSGIGCDMVRTQDGAIVHQDSQAGAGGVPVSPVDVVEQATRDLAPLAGLLPYGSALIAALLTGTGLYRKFKPTIDGFGVMVNAIEKLPQEAKSAYKANLASSGAMTDKTKIAISRLKLSQSAKARTGA